MAYRTVNLDNLNDIDPKIQAAFAMHMRRAVQDCLDRPGEKKARLIKMDVQITPILDDDGGCSKVHANFKMRGKIPEHSTRDFELVAQRNGNLLVNENSPTNPDQLTLDDVPAPGAEAVVPKLPPPEPAATDGKSAAAGD